MCGVVGGEAAVGAHLENLQLSEGYAVYYWRQRSDEVDFVLERKGKVLGIEVKSGATRKALGMEAFKKLYNPDKVFLIGKNSLPWQEFLKLKPSELF